MTKEVCSDDIDLDGDNDIIVGHSYSFNSKWGGISILKNNGSGYFNELDTICINGGTRIVLSNNFNNNDFPDIVTQSYNMTDGYVSIVYDFGNNNFSRDSILINPEYGYPQFITHGDVNGDGWEDIIASSNNGGFWGILFNDTLGSFYEPIYYFFDNHIVNVQCGDLNNDGFSEIIYALSDFKIKFYNYIDDKLITIDSTIAGEIFIIDYDVDNDNDIICKIHPPGINSTVIIFYENKGDFSFIKHNYFKFSQIAYRWNVTDLNNDNLPDLVFIGNDTITPQGDWYDRLFIFYNNGNFNISIPDTIYRTTSTLQSYTFFASNDIDDNGYNDLIFVEDNGHRIANLTILFNDGQKHFLEYPLDVKTPAKLTHDINLNCYPNPFSESTNITFSLEETTIVSLYIFDIKGETVTKIIEHEKIEYGKHYFSWNGKGMDNKKLSTGIYFVQLKINNNKQQSYKILYY